MAGSQANSRPSSAARVHPAQEVTQDGGGPAARSRPASAAHSQAGSQPAPSILDKPPGSTAVRAASKGESIRSAETSQDYGITRLAGSQMSMGSVGGVDHMGGQSRAASPAESNFTIGNRQLTRSLVASVPRSTVSVGRTENRLGQTEDEVDDEGEDEVDAGGEVPAMPTFKHKRKDSTMPQSLTATKMGAGAIAPPPGTLPRPQSGRIKAQGLDSKAFKPMESIGAEGPSVPKKALQVSKPSPDKPKMTRQGSSIPSPEKAKMTRQGSSAGEPFEPSSAEDLIKALQHGVPTDSLVGVDPMPHIPRRHMTMSKAALPPRQRALKMRMMSRSVTQLVDDQLPLGISLDDNGSVIINFRDFEEGMSQGNLPMSVASINAAHEAMAAIISREHPLHEIRFSGCRSGLNLFEAMLQLLHKVRDFDELYVNLADYRRVPGESTAERVGVLVEVLNTYSELTQTRPPVRHVDVSKNGLSKRDIYALTQCLINAKNLRILNITASKPGEYGVNGLKTLLLTNRNMTHLLLGDTEIKNVSLLSEGISHQSHLRVLDVRGIPMTETGAEALVEALMGLTGLRHLNMRHCHLGHQGGAAFKYVCRLFGLPSLKELVLAYNKLSKKVSKIFFDALCENTSLVILDMKGCDIDKSTMEEFIMPALKKRAIDLMTSFGIAVTNHERPQIDERVRDGLIDLNLRDNPKLYRSHGESEDSRELTESVYQFCGKAPARSRYFEDEDPIFGEVEDRFTDTMQRMFRVSAGPAAYIRGKLLPAYHLITYLSFSNQGMEIFKVSWVEQMYHKMTNLQQLDLSRNRLRTLPVELAILARPSPTGVNFVLNIGSNKVRIQSTDVMAVLFASNAGIVGLPEDQKREMNSMLDSVYHYAVELFRSYIKPKKGVRMAGKILGGMMDKPGGPPGGRSRAGSTAGGDDMRRLPTRDGVRQNSSFRSVRSANKSGVGAKSTKSNLETTAWGSDIFAKVKAMAKGEQENSPKTDWKTLLDRQASVGVEGATPEVPAPKSVVRKEGSTISLGQAALPNDLVKNRVKSDGGFRRPGSAASTRSAMKLPGRQSRQNSNSVVFKEGGGQSRSPVRLADGKDWDDAASNDSASSPSSGEAQEGGGDRLELWEEGGSGRAGGFRDDESVFTDAMDRGDDESDISEDERGGGYTSIIDFERLVFSNLLRCIPSTDVINHLDKDGRSALHIACMFNRSRAATWLVMAGATFNITSFSGYLPVEMYRSYFLRNLIDITWKDTYGVHPHRLFAECEDCAAEYELLLRLNTSEGRRRLGFNLEVNKWNKIIENARSLKGMLELDEEDFDVHSQSQFKFPMPHRDVNMERAFYDMWNAYLEMMDGTSMYLHLAAMKGNIAQIRAIKPYITTEYFEQDWNWRTPFHYACMQGNPDVLHEMIESSKESELMVSQKPMWHMWMVSPEGQRAMRGSSRQAKKLVKEMARCQKFNLFDKFHKTALHYAVQHMSNECVSLMCDENVDPLLPYSSNETPYNGALLANADFIDVKENGDVDGPMEVFVAKSEHQLSETLRILNTTSGVKRKRFRYLLSRFTKTFLVYLCFLFLLSVMSPTASQLGWVPHNSFLLNHDVYSAVTTEFITTEAYPTTFFDVNNIGLIWEWLEGPFLDILFATTDAYGATMSSTRQKYLDGQNRFLGSVRLRQVRSKKDDCFGRTVSMEASGTEEYCYPDFYLGSQDKSTFASTTWKDYGGTSWSGVKGLVYPDVGFATDIEPGSTTTASSVISALKTAKWIDEGTRAIFIDFSHYNGASNLVLFSRLVFELPATGGVIPSGASNVMQPYISTTFELAMTMIVEILVGIIVILYTLGELNELVVVGCKRYFSDMWNFFDMSVFFLFVVRWILQIALVAEWAIESVDIDDNSKFYNLYSVSELTTATRKILATIVLVCWLRVFKIIAILPAVGPVVEAVRATITNTKVVVFMMILCLSWWIFAVSAWIALGNNVEGYRDITLAGLSILRMTLGDVDVDLIKTASPVWGVMLFLLIVVFGNFLMLNLLIAVLTEVYSTSWVVNDKRWEQFINQMLVEELAPDLHPLSRCCLRGVICVEGCFRRPKKRDKYDPENPRPMKANDMKKTKEIDSDLPCHPRRLNRYMLVWNPPSKMSHKTRNIAKKAMAKLKRAKSLKQKLDTGYEFTISKAVTKVHKVSSMEVLHLGNQKELTETILVESEFISVWDYLIFLRVYVELQSKIEKLRDKMNAPQISADEKKMNERIDKLIDGLSGDGLVARKRPDLAQKTEGAAEGASKSTEGGEGGEEEEEEGGRRRKAKTLINLFTGLAPAEVEARLRRRLPGHIAMLAAHLDSLHHHEAQALRKYIFAELENQMQSAAGVVRMIHQVQSADPPTVEDTLRWVRQDVEPELSKRVKTNALRDADNIVESDQLDLDILVHKSVLEYFQKFRDSAARQPCAGMPLHACDDYDDTNVDTMNKLTRTLQSNKILWEDWPPGTISKLLKGLVNNEIELMQCTRYGEPGHEYHITVQYEWSFMQVLRSHEGRTLMLLETHIDQGYGYERRFSIPRFPVPSGEDPAERAEQFVTESFGKGMQAEILNVENLFLVTSRHSEEFPKMFQRDTYHMVNVSVDSLPHEDFFTLDDGRVRHWSWFELEDFNVLQMVRYEGERCGNNERYGGTLSEFCDLVATKEVILAAKGDFAKAQSSTTELLGTLEEYLRKLHDKRNPPATPASSSLPTIEDYDIPGTRPQSGMDIDFNRNIGALGRRPEENFAARPVEGEVTEQMEQIAFAEDLASKLHSLQASRAATPVLTEVMDEPLRPSEMSAGLDSGNAMIPYLETHGDAPGEMDRIESRGTGSGTSVHVAPQGEAEAMEVTPNAPFMQRTAITLDADDESLAILPAGPQDSTPRLETLPALGPPEQPTQDSWVDGPNPTDGEAPAPRARDPPADRSTTPLSERSVSTNWDPTADHGEDEGV